jgi:hypothetical protein
MSKITHGTVLRSSLNHAQIYLNCRLIKGAKDKGYVDRFKHPVPLIKGMPSRES